MSTPVAYLSLGSNIGDSYAYIQEALCLLRKAGIRIIKEAPYYSTAPVGFEDQPDFLNTVVAVTCKLSPPELLRAIKDIELSIGRTKTVHWGPREIDIDIILYQDIIFTSSSLHIPHKEMHKREFVLLPLSKIAPEVLHPKLQRSIIELLKEYYETIQRDSRGASLFTPT